MTAFPSEVNFSFIYFYFFLQMRDPFQLQKLVKQRLRIVPSSANSAISSTLRPPLHPLPVSPPPHHHHRSAETEQAAAGATSVFPPLCAVKQERAHCPPPELCVDAFLFPRLHTYIAAISSITVLRQRSQIYGSCDRLSRGLHRLPLPACSWHQSHSSRGDTLKPDSTRVSAFSEPTTTATSFVAGWHHIS